MKLSALQQGLVGIVPLILILGMFFWTKRSVLRYRTLIALTLAATFFLILLGAYVRLADAGLGCPDWPGCYGSLTPHHAAAEIQVAEIVQPGGPVTLAKAWKEMVHRYLAMVVGALIAAIMLVAWRNRRWWMQSPVIPTVIAATVILQAALGALTVTLLLKPAIVTSHLLGGIAIFSLLVWHLFRQPDAGNWTNAITANHPILRGHALVAIAVLFVQIALGGWVSTNYAALACSDLPTCHGAWVPNMDFNNAFHIFRPLGMGPDGALLTMQALTAIHWTHRVGAVVAFMVVGGFAWKLLAIESGRKAARFLALLLVTQIVLGISNIWFSLPLLVAVAHNGVAAVLFAWLLVINLRLAK